MNFFREKKYIWIPALLVIYTAVLALMNLDGLNTEKGRTSFWTTIACQAVVIVLLIIFLKKRAKLRRKREDLSRKNDKANS